MADTHFWDKKAQHFQNTMEHGRTEIKNDLMNHLRNEGMVFFGGRVMDIGCGTGRYAVEFLKENMFVSCLDVSEKMLEFAEMNLKKISNNFELILSEWGSISVEKLTEKGRYDLVFASNSPGVRTFDDIKKMCEISRKYCFINKFARRTDHLKDAFSECIGISENPDKGKSYLTILEHIKSLGYEPVFEFADQCWSDMVTPEEAVNNFIDFKKLDGMNLTLSDKEKLRECAESLKDEKGLLEEKTTAKAIWIKWEV